MFADGVVDVVDIIIDHVLCPITAAWDGTSVGSFEEPAVLVVTFDTKTPFVHELMVTLAQQHQVLETRFTAGRPVSDVMGIDEARVVATRKHTALVSCSQCTFDRRGYGASLAANAEWIALFVFNDDNCIAVTTSTNFPT